MFLSRRTYALYAIAGPLGGGAIAWALSGDYLVGLTMLVALGIGSAISYRRRLRLRF